MTATIGHNNPPEPTPYEALTAHILDLWELAEGALTGQPIVSQEQADQIEGLADDCLKAWQAAEAVRKDEKRPHDEAAAAVQAKWKPLTDKANLAKKTALDALTPWKLELQRQKDAAAAKAREEAEELARKAREAAQASVGDLTARADAEALLKQADKATKAANRIDRAPTGLRTYWHAEITDRRAALNHYIRTAPNEFVSLIEQLANQDIRAGVRNIPGVEAVEEKRAA